MEKLKKPMLIVCGGFVLLFIFLFIMASCNKKSYTTVEFENLLLEKAEAYFQTNKDALPKNDGKKVSLSIGSLVEKQSDYLKDTTCSGSIDVINNNGYYLYVPNINCSDGFGGQKLAEHLINKDVVTSANGLYQMNGEYVYRGDNVNNYIVFNNQLFRIIKINSDGTLRIIETDYKVKYENDSIDYKSNRRTSTNWDNRFNSEKNYSSGFNDYIHDGLNSRIKDTLEDIYKNELSAATKAYIVSQDLCIGKRSVTDSINDGSIECSSVVENQYVGLLPIYEYLNASLDPDCLNIDSSSCSNYNYLSDMNSTYWSMTAVKENSYDVFKIGNSIVDATANSSATPKIVLNLSSEVSFAKGDGTEENPYILN